MAAAVAAPALLGKFSEAELDQTVEQFLRGQCQQRVDALKRHIDGLVDSFAASATTASLASTSACSLASDGGRDASSRSRCCY